MARGKVTGGASSPSSCAGAETRALETMVHEMLQPILREWCDKNLPRIVEATLKDELARAVKLPRDVDQT